MREPARPYAARLFVGSAIHVTLAGRVRAAGRSRSRSRAGVRRFARLLARAAPGPRVRPGSHVLRCADAHGVEAVMVGRGSHRRVVGDVRLRERFGAAARPVGLGGDDHGRRDGGDAGDLGGDDHGRVDDGVADDACTSACTNAVCGDGRMSSSCSPRCSHSSSAVRPRSPLQPVQELVIILKRHQQNFS